MTTKTRKAMGRVGVGAGSVSITAVVALVAKLLYAAVQDDIEGVAKVNTRQDVTITAVVSDVSDVKANMRGLEVGQQAIVKNQERMITAIMNLKND